MLDFKQSISVRPPPSDDFVTVDLPVRRERTNPEHYVKIDMDMILDSVERISKHNPKAIVLMIENDSWRDKEDKLVREFGVKLKKYSKVHLYLGIPRYSYLASDERILPFERIIDHWDRTQDRDKPPYDGKSRFTHLRIHQSGMESDLIRFLREMGFVIRQEDFRWSIDYLGTSQILTKYYPKGSFSERTNASPDQTLNNKIVLVGFADPMNASVTATPFSSKNSDGLKENNLGRSFMWNQEFLANLLANIAYKTGIKPVSRGTNIFYLAICTLILCFGILSVSNATSLVRVFAWIMATNIFPIVVFFLGDVFLDSIPVALASILVPYFMLPFVLFRAAKKSTLAKIEAEKSIDVVRAQGLVVAKSAQADATFRMAVRLAHDIRGPLSALRIAAQSIDDSNRSKSLITKSVQKLIDITNSLLPNRGNLTAFGNKQIQLTEISSLLSDIENHISLVAPDVEFHGVSETHLKFIPLQKVELERHLLNMATNSIEAFRIAKTLSPKLSIKIAQVDGSIVIRITDNGPGVAHEHRTEIFKPGGSVGKIDGNGIGLSSAYSFLKNAGGSITLEESNVGCIFTITVPIEVAQVEILVKGFLVIVDDDVHIRKLFENQLTKYPEKMITGDPSEAIQCIREMQGQITVISDLIFPNSDLIGFDILHSARSSSLKYLYSTLGSEESIQAVAQKSHVIVIDKAQIPVLVLGTDSTD